MLSVDIYFYISPYFDNINKLNSKLEMNIKMKDEHIERRQINIGDNSNDTIFNPEIFNINNRKEWNELSIFYMKKILKNIKSFAYKKYLLN